MHLFFFPFFLFFPLYHTIVNDKNLKDEKNQLLISCLWLNLVSYSSSPLLFKPCTIRYIHLILGQEKIYPQTKRLTLDLFLMCRCIFIAKVSAIFYGLLFSFAFMNICEGKFLADIYFLNRQRQKPPSSFYLSFWETKYN